MMAAVETPRNSKVQLVWGTLRSGPVLVFVALAIVVATVTLTLWPRNRISAANFDRIQIGMSQAELRGLLGSPQIDDFELGKARGSEEYVSARDDGVLLLTNRVGTTCLDGDYRYSKVELRLMGFQDYQCQTWVSSEIRIYVISDQEGHVACRFRHEGRPWDWHRFLGPPRYWW
jgi:hypothetical protein